MLVRIITFLGLGGKIGELPGPPPLAVHGYQPAQYRLDEVITESTWNHDVASLRRYQGDTIELVVLGTEKVEGQFFGSDDRYTTELERLGIDVIPCFSRIPDGDKERDLWTILEHITEEVSRAPKPGKVIIDLTHGYRSQVIFASAAAAHIRGEARRREHSIDLRLLYAAFEARNLHGGVAPVWDLTTILDLFDWTAATEAMLRFGRGGDLARLARRSQARTWSSTRDTRRSRVTWLSNRWAASARSSRMIW